MEKVNHPHHYTQPGRKECIYEMIDNLGPEIVYAFCLGSAYKYLYRAGNKPGEEFDEDKKKAEWYLDFSDMVFSERIKDGMSGAREKISDMFNF